MSLAKNARIIATHGYGASNAGTVTGAESALTSVSGWATTNNEFQGGWEFTVGGSDIEVTHLLFYNTGETTETVKIWRVSDETIIASASVTGAAAGYGQTSITPVTLSASTNYIVSHENGGTTRTVYRNPGTYTVNSNVAYADNWYDFHNVFPNSPSSNKYFAANFRFDVIP